MKNKIRQIIALTMTVALVVTMVTFADGNTIKAANDENGQDTNQPIVAEENVAVEEPASEETQGTVDQDEPTTETKEIVLDGEEEKPVEEQKDDSEDNTKPEQTLTDKASDGAVITVTAPSGALPKGAKVTAKVVNSSRYEGAIESSVEKNGMTVKGLAAYDITITDKDGKKIQPDKSVKVVISGADVHDGSADVYHMNGNTPEKVASGVNAERAQFNANSFSVYIVTGTDRDSEQNVTTAYFYIQRPGKNPMSLEDEDWKYVGEGTINTKNIGLAAGRDAYTLNGIVERVITYPNDSVIKERIAELSDVDVDDVIITYTPYKISYPMGYVDENMNSHSGNKACYHVDMTVSIKTKEKASINYFLWDAGADGYAVVESEMIEFDSTTSFRNEYPTDKTVNDEEYVLVGWYDNPELTGDAVEFPYTVTDASNFYAKYVKQDKITIDYKVVGPKGSGTLSKDSESLNPKTGVAKGSTANATKGYTFQGWYSDKACTHKISSNKKYTPSKDGAVWESATYYAKFTSEKAEIIFDANGGSDVAGIEGVTGQTIENKDMPSTEKDGYTFLGWTDKDGNLVTTLPDEFPDGTTTYYAQWGNLNATGYNGTYDGQSHKPTAVSVDGNNGGLASKYNQITYQVKDENGSWSNFDGIPSVKDVESLDVRVVAKAAQTNGLPTLTKVVKLTVTPVDVQLTAKSDSKEYDGTALTNGGYDITEGSFVGEEGLQSVTVTGSQKEVGSSDNQITEYALKDNTKAGNYNITTKKGQLKVTASEEKVIVKISGKTDTKTYNGKEQSVEGYTVDIDSDLYKASDIEFSGTDTAKGTDAGEYTMSLKADQFANTNSNFKTVEFQIEKDGKLTVTPVDVQLTAKSDSKEYDGTALTNGGYDITEGSFVGEEGLQSVTVTGSQKEVGSSDNQITEYALKDNTKAGNYNITTKKGQLKVTASEEKVIVKISGKTDTKTYNGKEQSVEGYTVDIDSDLYKASDIEFSGTDTAKGTDAGEYTMSLKADQFANTNSNFKTVEFQIEKDGGLQIDRRPVTFTSGDETKVYNGTALTGNAANIAVSDGSIVEGESFGYEMTGTQTKVGSSKNTFNYLAQEGTKASNYDITTEFGTLTVTANGTTPVNPDDDNTGNTPGDGNQGAAPLVGVVTGAANGNYDVTTIKDNKTPLANNLLTENCCILHLLIMLAALIAFVIYTRDMKKRQKRIFQLEEELDNIRE